MAFGLILLAIVAIVILAGYLGTKTK